MTFVKHKNHKYLISFSIIENDKQTNYSRVVILYNKITSEESLYQLEGCIRDNFYNKGIIKELNSFLNSKCTINGFSYLGKTEESVTKFL